jgi:hypothetical protein
MHPLALAESGRVWVGTGSRLGCGRGKSPLDPLGSAPDAALPVQQQTATGAELDPDPTPCMGEGDRIRRCDSCADLTFRFSKTLDKRARITHL